MLRAAGWQVVPARRGDTVADAWTRLLMGGAAARGTAASAAVRTAADIGSVR